MTFFVGLDWASTAHAVCVLDDTGTVRWRGSVPHSAEGLAELVRRLRQCGPPATVHVAIECPSGVVIDTLMDAGIQVVPIHPNVVKASRARYSAAHAKSDEGDSYLLADLLRTDGHRFRPLRPLADETRALRALVRGRDDLVGQRVNSPIALAFLARYPTPQSAERVGERRLVQFLRRHAYCGRRPAAELLGRLRRAPVGRAGEAECDASGDLVRSVVAVLVPPRRPDPATLGGDRRRPGPADPEPAAQWAGQCGPASSPNSAMTAPVSPPRNSCPLRPGPPPSPARPGGTGPSSSAGRATSASAKPSRHSPITRGMPRRGRPPFTPAPARAAAIIPTPSGSWPLAWLRVIWRCWQDRQPYDVTRHRAATLSTA